MINSPPAVSRSAKSSTPAVPRVVFTDPQAAAVGATNDRFSGTARLSQLSKRFLTLLADGQHLTGAYATAQKPASGFNR
jgi:pyruvate/2-oxoglutarate dehydrogenase complex dihydrolipoamide dehydrogenase (E3) component